MQPGGYRGGTNTADMGIYDVNLGTFMGDVEATVSGGPTQAKGNLFCYPGHTVTVSIERWNGAWADAESPRLTCQ